MAYRNKEHRSPRLSRVKSRKDYIPQLSKRDDPIKISVAEYLKLELKKLGAVPQAIDSDVSARHSILDS